MTTSHTHYTVYLPATQLAPFRVTKYSSLSPPTEGVDDSPESAILDAMGKLDVQHGELLESIASVRKLMEDLKNATV